MTLNTAVYVQDPIPVREVFDFCRGLIGATDRHAWKDEDRSKYGSPGDRYVAMVPAQGLPAWLWVYYAGDLSDNARPLRPDGATHDEYCEEGCDGEYHEPAHWIKATFDTTYSWHDEHGGCGALHARLVAALGQWLDKRGVRWCWKNEFTGDIHESGDVEALLNLAGNDRNVQGFAGLVNALVERGALA